MELNQYAKDNTDSDTYNKFSNNIKIGIEKLKKSKKQHGGIHIYWVNFTNKRLKPLIYSFK